jgi:hypothetical protein
MWCVLWQRCCRIHRYVTALAILAIFFFLHEKWIYQKHFYRFVASCANKHFSLGAWGLDCRNFGNFAVSSELDIDKQLLTKRRDEEVMDKNGLPHIFFWLYSLRNAECFLLAFFNVIATTLLYCTVSIVVLRNLASTLNYILYSQLQ